MSEKKMWIYPVEKLVETPYMTEEDKVLVEKFNSDPKYKFWLVFYSAKTKEDILETMDAECYFSFLFNSKYELHKDLEYMFEEGLPIWLVRSHTNFPQNYYTIDKLETMFPNILD